MVWKLKLGNQFRQLLLDTREGLKTSAIFSGWKSMGTLSAKHFCIAILSSSAMFTGLCALPADAQGTQATDTKQYSPVEITNIPPEEILPVLKQHRVGDKYETIEHLGIAENVRISDMMHKYGAWYYSPEEYQQLMSRINVGTIWEAPLWYDDYEVIWWWSGYEPSEHAATPRDRRRSICKYANKYVVTNRSRADESLKEYIEKNPNSINIFWESMTFKLKKQNDIKNIWKGIKNMTHWENFIIFASWGNIHTRNGSLLKKVYNQDYEMEDENWIYIGSASVANSDKNTDPDNHIIVTISTNKYGDIDQTYETIESSLYPVGFAEESLAAGRTAPYYDPSYGFAWSESWKYANSNPTQHNASHTTLLTQNFADVDGVSEILHMLRSTADSDYIRFDLNGDWDTNDTVSIAQSDGSYLHQPETVSLPLYNYAKAFVKYGMAINETGWKRPSIQMPAEIASGQVSSLEKGWYKGVVFLFPGTEVLVDGEWIPFDNDNFQSTIKNCNPFHLEFRMNGDLLVQQGFKVGDAIEGTIQAVDDQWWGLKDISKPFTLTLTDNPDSIGTLAAGNQSTKSSWYTISGQKLSKRPTKPGIYIHNGKKVVIQ